MEKEQRWYLLSENNDCQQHVVPRIFASTVVGQRKVSVYCIQQFWNCIFGESSTHCSWLVKQLIFPFEVDIFFHIIITIICLTLVPSATMLLVFSSPSCDGEKTGQRYCSRRQYSQTGMRCQWWADTPSWLAEGWRNGIPSGTRETHACDANRRRVLHNQCQTDGFRPILLHC